MVNLILFIMAVIGLCHVLVDSSLFAPVREWIAKQTGKPWCFIAKILGCYQCCGVWTGWFCGLCLLTNWSENLFTNFAVVLMAGFAGSFLSSLAANYITYLSAKSVIELPPEHHE